MQSRAITQLPRERFQDERPSALAYWGTGCGGIGVVVLVFLLAGFRF